MYYKKDGQIVRENMTEDQRSYLARTYYPGNTIERYGMGLENADMDKNKWKKYLLWVLVLVLVALVLYSLWKMFGKKSPNVMGYRFY